MGGRRDRHRPIPAPLDASAQVFQCFRRQKSVVRLKRIVNAADTAPQRRDQKGAMGDGFGSGQADIGLHPGNGGNTFDRFIFVDILCLTLPTKTQPETVSQPLFLGEEFLAFPFNSPPQTKPLQH